MILLEPAYKISQVEIKRRTISVIATFRELRVSAETLGGLVNGSAFPVTDPHQLSPNNPFAPMCHHGREVRYPHL
jgi:hypothetical protein